tara:strand:+ start:375 stop:575 length:201 start_codon:yes stop_codon:yes gene_type:complete
MDKVITNYLKEFIDNDELENINEYISTLNKLELKTLSIAILHLKTSFNILKSIGYQDWLKKNKNNA